MRSPRFTTTTTVTSKGQITIPVWIVRKLGLVRGTKIHVSLDCRDPEVIVFTPVRHLMKELAGSLGPESGATVETAREGGSA